MKRCIKKGIHFCLWFSVCLGAGHAIAAIAPDSGIRAELQKLFADPPIVEGYPYQHLLATAAASYNLPLPFVLAVARGESFFNPKARSAKGALGVMQVMPSTAADYGVKTEDLLDPAKNIDVGVHFLADLYAQFQDPYLTLAGYYCGNGGVDKEGFTLRQDCDEYVRYIYSHLQKILTSAKGEALAAAGEVQRFVLARFDNFLDAESFVGFLSRKLPELQIDLFRGEVVRSDHLRYQYQILAALKQDKEKQEICLLVEKATGFSFCR
jgi:soluble lytic murein transglycosylase-like protein